jgi:hypothetical protein
MYTEAVYYHVTPSDIPHLNVVSSINKRDQYYQQHNCNLLHNLLLHSLLIIMVVTVRCMSVDMTQCL